MNIWFDQVIMKYYETPIHATWVYLSPEVYLAISCLVILSIIGVANFKPQITDFWKQKFFSSYLITTTIKTLSLIIVLFVWFAWTNPHVSINLISDYMVLDFYNLMFKIVILLTGIFILNNSFQYIVQHWRNCIEYAFLILLTLFFLVILIGSSSLILMFVCIIGFSLNMYTLIMYDSPYQPSLEAGAKYFYLSALSSGLISSGLFLTYLWLLWNKFWLITFTLYCMSHLPNSSIDLGLGTIALFSIIYGFLFKLAAFPCHLWAPEIYDGSPNPVMGIFVLPIKVATLVIFIKLLTNVFKDAYIIWSYLIWFSAAMSMIWGCLGAYSEDKIKKFIAYSSINQMGFLLIGVTCGAFNGIKSTIIYLLIYIIMNWGFLQIYLNTFNNITWKNIEFLTELKYFSPNNWIYSIGLAIILFSMAGIPPLAGFFGKYFLFLVAFQSEYYLLVIIGMMTSLISTFYYLRIIKIMWFENSQLSFITTQHLELTTSMSWFQRQTYFAATIFIIFFLLLSKSLFEVTTLMTTACQLS